MSTLETIIWSTTCNAKNFSPAQVDGEVDGDGVVSYEQKLDSTCLVYFAISSAAMLPYIYKYAHLQTSIIFILPPKSFSVST